MREERPWITRRSADSDAEGTRENLLRMIAIKERLPELIIIPAHDMRAYAEMPTLSQASSETVVEARKFVDSLTFNPMEMPDLEKWPANPGEPAGDWYVPRHAVAGAKRLPGPRHLSGLKLVQGRHAVQLAKPATQSAPVVGKSAGDGDPSSRLSVMEGRGA